MVALTCQGLVHVDPHDSLIHDLVQPTPNDAISVLANRKLSLLIKRSKKKKRKIQQKVAPGLEPGLLEHKMTSKSSVITSYFSKLKYYGQICSKLTTLRNHEVIACPFLESIHIVLILALLEKGLSRRGTKQ
jgi:hypothetical protein